jgi:hypothetical protein
MTPPRRSISTLQQLKSALRSIRRPRCTRDFAPDNDNPSREATSRCVPEEVPGTPHH